MNLRRCLMLLVVCACVALVARHPHPSSALPSVPPLAPFAPAAARIVAVGDSITADPAHRGLIGDWPSLLAAILRQPVIDRGRGSNAVASSYAGTGGGSALVDRFRADVLGVRGVRTVIVLEGHNDIRYSGTDQSGAVIAGLATIIAQAHAAHVRVICGTLVPWAGERGDTARREAERAAVNAWIHGPGHCDGAIDFAAVLATPRRPTRLLPAYDSGDGIHPNARGERMMALAAAHALS